MEADWETASVPQFNSSVSAWDDDDDDWENATVPVLSQSQITALENQRKVEESDVKIAQSLFGDDEEDLTLLEMKNEKEQQKIITDKVPRKAGKQKRQLTEEEIEKREEKKRSNEIKKESISKKESK